MNPLGLRLRCGVPGRERWEVDALYRRPRLSRAVEIQLLKVPEVVKVRANPDTARLLLLFTPELAGRTRAAIIRVLGRLLPLVGNKKPEAAKIGLPRQSLIRLRDKLAPEPGLFRNAALLSSAYAVINLLPHFGLVSLMNTARNRNNPLLSSLGIARVGPQMCVLFLGTMASFGVVIALELKKQKAWRRLAADLEQKARLKAFDHIQNQDMSFCDAQSKGKLIRLLLEDVDQVRIFWEQGADAIVQKILYTGIIILGLGLVSPGLAGLSLLPLELILLTAGWFKRRMVPKYARVGEDRAQVSHLLSNNLSGIETVKSFTAEAYELERLAGAGNTAARSDDQAFDIGSLYANSLRLFLYTGWVSVLTGAGLLLARGRITQNAYSNVVYLMPSLINSIKGLNETVDMYRKSTAASDRLLEILETGHAIVDGPRRLPESATRGVIAYKDVAFGYEPGTPVLDRFSLDIPPGELTAFVGATGTGKSTIIKLLMRFYEVSSGTITMDGIDIRDVSLSDLRSAIGYVSQDVYLFYGTVYENIVYGRQGASAEDVRAAARAAEADGFIRQLPDGYDTVIGERGQKLSLGQRQRLSLARAVLKNPPILLLDEATSSVDNETEAAIQRSVRRLSRGRTTIVIAHRLSTVRTAHCIHLVDGGCVRESGSHDTLIGQEGLYAGLWKVQTGDVNNREAS